MKKVLKVVWNIIFYVAIAALVFNVLMFSLSNNPNKSFLGYRFYNVLSGSMTPTIYKGDMVFVKVTSAADIKIGDIVTYAASSDPTGKTVVTHRVTAVKKGNDQQPVFTTQGDANPTADKPVSAGQIVGVAVGKLRYVGGILDFVREHVLIVLIFTVAVLLLVTGMKLIFGKKRTSTVE